MPPPPWPVEKIAQLKALVEGGATFAKIGAKMGITKNMAIGKAHRMGFEPPPTAPMNSFQAGQANRIKPPVSTITERLDALGIFPGLGMCVFPLPRGMVRVTSFCGAEAREGEPYCGEHRSLCWANVRLS